MTAAAFPHCLTTRLKYNMDTFTGYLAVFAIAFYLGWTVNGHWMAMTFRKLLQDLNVTDLQLKQLAERNGIPLPPEPQQDHTDQRPTSQVEIRVETYENQLWAYEEQQNTFVAQASSPEELLQKIIDKYPPGTSIMVDKNKGGDLINQAAVKLKVQAGES